MDGSSCSIEQSARNEMISVSCISIFIFIEREFCQLRREFLCFCQSDAFSVVVKVTFMLQLLFDKPRASI